MKEAQDARTEDIMWEDVHRLAYKCGSMMLFEQSNGWLPLKALSNAEGIAVSLNDFYGCKLLTGEELIGSLKNGQVGLSPPQKGPQSKISDNDFKKLCELVFTHPNRSTKQTAIQIVSIDQ